MMASLYTKAEDIHHANSKALVFSLHRDSPLRIFLYITLAVIYNSILDILFNLTLQRYKKVWKEKGFSRKN